MGASPGKASLVGKIEIECNRGARRERGGRYREVGKAGFELGI
jgi:hypothetical protein